MRSCCEWHSRDSWDSWNPWNPWNRYSDSPKGITVFVMIQPAAMMSMIKKRKHKNPPVYSNFIHKLFVSIEKSDDRKGELRTVLLLELSFHVSFWATAMISFADLKLSSICSSLLIRLRTSGSNESSSSQLFSFFVTGS